MIDYLIFRDGPLKEISNSGLFPVTEKEARSFEASRE